LGRWHHITVYDRERARERRSVSPADNKAVVRRLVEEVYNQGNLDVVDELMSPDIFDHAAVPEHQHGIDGFKHVMEWVRTFSSDVHYDIDDIIAEGDKVAVRMTQSGTHTGTVRDIPPLASVSQSTTSTGFVLRTGRWRRCGP
jgi:predicted ester cyclase